jgi:hypothetical protein
MHQLSNTGARVAFASKETFPLVKKCALQAGILAENIFLFENDSIPGFTTYADLLKYGEYEWARLTRLDQVSHTCVKF